ncbi:MULTISPECIES: enoyl-CoA hydratase-related protein [Alicyclobacillus]|uniref:Enoyl-CoA hydratase-related protein n=1 Tax=Alicyclobacillus acidoterrestris (strain ATCC 49025 / DSM 3922 / CIP 106132 / NCIMB 13137 / GD3B) TaxID=1356854 RepID=A0A9E6ZKF7_ALIAG|nr:MULTISPECIES: enoyl-CoA hydratase-related protein [Alicyclobacillus]UNO50953.1 enoyl-CoA hydratase-related protein [Alicyclobacillus acidoterrestris]
MGRSYKYISVDVDGFVALVELRRHQAHNALNLELMEELVAELERLDVDDDVRCTVLTGSTRAFAAGADISEMVDATAVEMKLRNQFRCWDRIRWLRKPLIAAVNGYALGGGCELAMACDIIVAGENAKFGQPEVNLGIMPGAGGTQRLVRAVGKARALEILLTGEPITAEEALQFGLINRVVPSELCVQEALRIAQVISSKAPLAVQLIKESVGKAYDSTLQDGMEYERNCFYLLCGSQDKTEGMRAFMEKRQPFFQGR